MVFVEDSIFEKQEKNAQMKKAVEKKREQASVIEQAKPVQSEKSLSKQIILNEIAKRHKPEKEHVITLKDIKNEIEFKKIIEKEKEVEINDILQNGEIKEIKHTAINLLAIPHQNPVKRHLFSQRLQKSEIINNYVDNNVIFKLFNKANDNLKFGVVYGINYLQTNDDYNRLVAISQRQKQPEPEPEQKTEEPKTEEQVEPKTEEPEKDETEETTK